MIDVTHSLLVDFPIVGVRTHMPSSDGPAHIQNTYDTFLVIEVAQGHHHGNKETGYVWLNNHVMNVVDFVISHFGSSKFLSLR